jgi:hypothetical protein
MTERQQSEAQMLDHCEVQVAHEGRCEIVSPPENTVERVELPSVMVPEPD